MLKPDPTVRNETLYIFTVSLLLSVLMQSVFLIAGFWDLTVLWGNLLGLAAAVGNFFLMGITVQSALGKEAKEVQNRMKLSQMFRMLILFLIAVIGYAIPCFHLLAVILPYLFPRFAIALRPLLRKK